MTNAEWRKRYWHEVEVNIWKAGQINKSASVKTRPLTAKEMHELFVKKNSAYIKEISV